MIVVYVVGWEPTGAGDECQRRAAALLDGEVGTFGCASNVVVPREAASEVRDYLGAVAGLGAVRSTWTRRRHRVAHDRRPRHYGAAAVGDRIVAVATVDRWSTRSTRAPGAFLALSRDTPYGVGPVMTGGDVRSREGREGKLTAISVATGKPLAGERGRRREPAQPGDSAVHGPRSRVAFAYRTDTGLAVDPQRRPDPFGPLLLGRHVVYATLTDTLVV